MEKMLFLFLLFIFTLIYGEDPRNSNYEYLGTWIITETFQLDSLWIEDIYDSSEAEIMEGEIIVYKKNEYIFQNNVYPIIKVNSDYYTSASLRDATNGSVAQGYGFEDLHLNKNVKEIRDVVFSTASEDSLGRCFFVVDNNTILIHWRGWVFKAEKYNS